MIGEIRWSLTPYYDVSIHKNALRRPVLLIAKADNEDYVALPVSRVTKRHNIDPVYDIQIDPAAYPALHLTDISYARTHKQMIVHEGEITGLIGNLKSDYPDLYLSILEKREQFSKEISTQAIE